MMMTGVIDLRALETLARSLDCQLRGAESLVAAQASEDVVVESVLEALMPLVQVYEHLQQRETLHPLPWPRGTVVRWVDTFSATATYGVVADDAQDALAIRVRHSDGELTVESFGALAWVSAPCPTSWALLAHSAPIAG
jgi:hypothetical protein